jgi:Protein of unknown function (DUF1631)
VSGPNEDNKVVDLTQRQSNLGGLAADRLGELLKAVRATALKRINGLVGTLFENVDDALFDLAEKAENNAAQTAYFDGMREVRKKRQLVERVFQEQLSKTFNDFAAGKLQPVRADFGSQASGNSGLSLVDNLELEESLAIGSMVAKAENRQSQQLYSVNQRLSVLRGGVKVEDSTNPIAPAPLGAAFRVAMREFDLDVQGRLIVYKLFDRYVMSGLDVLYDEVNKQLIQSGVLPQIRPTLPNAGQRGPYTGPVSRAPGNAPPPAVTGELVEHIPGGAGYGAYDPAAAQLQAEIYNTLRSLLANRRPVPGGSDTTELSANPGVIGPPIPNLAHTELLSALTLLQNQAMVAQNSATTAVDAAQVVNQIKHELLDQAEKFHAGQKAHVASADEDTIDLVGMLFEFILQDRNLPLQMQALLGRLQIPILKVAILDKHLFAQKTHPARILLDTMAQACISWSEESDKDHRLYEKVKDTVDTVLKEFDDDVSVFERTQKDFENFLDSNKKRAELAEQRAAEATRGREKLQEARRKASTEIHKRIDGKQLPAIMQSVLTRPWANFLVLTMLRQGEDSNEWKQALRFADEFVWSAEPKINDADRTRLKGLLPVLEKHLRHGLATVAYHENDVKQLMHGLNALYQRLLTPPAPVSTTVRADDPATLLTEDDTQAMLEIVDKGQPAPAPEPEPDEEQIIMSSAAEGSAAANYSVDDEFLQQAKAMKVGTWVEFTNADTGGKERAKLSWISPISSKYLFVNRKGLKVADKTVFALSAELRRGATMILEEVPLFDRALDAIVERLKAAHSVKPEVVASDAPKTA